MSTQQCATEHASAVLEPHERLEILCGRRRKRVKYFQPPSYFDPSLEGSSAVPGPHTAASSRNGQDQSHEQSWLSHASPL